MKKKFLSFTLLLSLMFCCFCFAGCTGTPKSYEVIVKSLHYNLGSVEGGNATFKQGQTITIKARPTSESTNFYCWLLNNKVVSTEKEYSFVVSDKTAGEYVALFECPCLEYYALSEISYNENASSAENASNISISNIDIYFGKLDNLLTKIYSYEPEESNKKQELSSIYEIDNLPYAYDIQESIYIQIVITYTADETDFVSTTKHTIEPQDITKSSFEHEIPLSTSATNPQDEDFSITLTTEPKLTLTLNRLDNKDNSAYIFDFLNNQSDDDVQE